MTSYEFAVLQAYECVEPCGEERADYREAWNVAHIMQSLRTEPLGQLDFFKLVKGLIKYLKQAEEDDG